MTPPGHHWPILFKKGACRPPRAKIWHEFGQLVPYLGPWGPGGPFLIKNAVARGGEASEEPNPPNPPAIPPQPVQAQSFAPRLSKPVLFKKEACRPPRAKIWHEFGQLVPYLGPWGPGGLIFVENKGSPSK